MSSPPPPAQFRPSVSFDTFTNKEAADFSLTLNRKHRDYEYTKRSRTFLCGTDTNDYSDTALEWLIDEIVDDGDEVVCLRVVEKDSKDALRWAGGGKGYQAEAERFLDGIERKNTEDRAISLILEFSVGKVQEAIQQMIRVYEPAMLVVGTRGRSLTGYQGLLSSGSVSKYCLQYSPVPVIVVRPSAKRAKKKAKRQRDPERTGYRDILDKSEDAPRGRGGHLLDAQNRSAGAGNAPGALGDFGGSIDPDLEARMVAEALGIKGSSALAATSGRSSTPLGSNSGSRRRSSSLSRVGTGESVRSTSEPGALLKSPSLRGMESPESSDEEDAEGEFDVEGEEVLRPEDEAARLAYERALKIVEEEAEEARVRAESRGRGAGRTGSGGSSRGGAGGGGGGAQVLGLLEQLEKGG